MSRPTHAGFRSRLFPASLLTGGVAVIAALAAALATAAHGSAAPKPTSADGGYPPASTILVKYRSGVSSAAAVAIERAAHGSLVQTIDPLGVRVIHVRPGTVAAGVAALRSNRAVQFAEPNATAVPADTVPNDPYFKTGSGALMGGEWELPQIKAPATWDMTTGTATSVIAIVDSGVAPHPDLVGRLLTGHNVLTNSTDSSDAYGHGTYVAGVVAADSNNAQGVAGTCWNCKLLPVKVFTNSTGAAVSDLATGITWAADHGAKVINVSLGTTSKSSTLDSAVSYATTHGALVVASAGNSGCDCPTYPAASPGALGVAASDQKDTVYSYSNYGTWVGIDAPSGEVTTALTDPSTGAQWGYMPVGGTSLAAPIVAGVAGLVSSVASGLSPSSLRSLLMQNVDPVTGTNTVASGRINAYKALLAAGASGPSPSTSPEPTSSLTSTGLSPTPTTPSSTATTPSPSPTASTSAAPATVTFSGSLTTKSTSKSFPLTMGAGATRGALTFSKCTSMTMSLVTSTGSVVASASGPSGASVSATISAGNYVWSAAGSGRCTFALTVTYQA